MPWLVLFLETIDIYFSGFLIPRIYYKLVIVRRSLCLRVVDFMMNSSMHERALCHSSASKGSARTGDLGFNHFDERENAATTA
jgi:hypothetical protein